LKNNLNRLLKIKILIK